jgi:hypothetical protein
MKPEVSFVFKHCGVKVGTIIKTNREIAHPFLFPRLVPIFLTHLFFGITQDVTNLQRLYHAVFHVLRGPRPQDAGTPLLSSVLTSESDSGPGKGLHRQSNLP